MAECTESEDGPKGRVFADVGLVVKDQHACPPARETAQHGQKVQNELWCAHLLYLRQQFIEPIYDKSSCTQGCYPYDVRIPVRVDVDEWIEESYQCNAEEAKDEVVTHLLLSSLSKQVLLYQAPPIAGEFTRGGRLVKGEP